MPLLPITETDVTSIVVVPQGGPKLQILGVSASGALNLVGPATGKRLLQIQH